MAADDTKGKRISIKESPSFFDLLPLRITILSGFLRKHLWCRFLHGEDMCIPGVGGSREWHCSRCTPCWPLEEGERRHPKYPGDPGY